MLSPFEGFLLLFFIVFVASILYYLARDKNLPPGPIGLPFLGCIPYIKPCEHHKILSQWVEKYGPLMSFYMGSRPVVVLGNSEVVKEALVKQADVFSGRALPMVPRFLQVTKSANMGLILSNGELWKEQRRFALSTLRDFGIGRPIMENNIVDEMGYLFDELDNLLGKGFDPQEILNKSVSNIIAALVFGKRFDYTDAEFFETIDNMNKLAGGVNILASFNYFPIMVLFTNFFKVRAAGKQLNQFSVKHLKEHQQNFNIEEEPSNYIDAFLKAQAEGQGQYFSDKQLTVAIMNLFLAGSETTSTTLRWALLYMGHYPDVQARVHEEIRAVAGASVSPTWSQKAKLPYTEAVIMETQRFCNLLPHSVPHCTTADTKIMGYHVPKDTIVLPLLWAVQRDKNLFGEDALTFRPERFLEADGKTIKRNDGFMPFSTGKRVCLGESLAKMELFLFFTSLIVRYRIHFGNYPKPGITDCITGITIAPKPYKIIAEIRL